MVINIDLVQCNGKTGSGKHCYRKVCPLQKFCFQHSGQKLVYKDRNICIDPQKLVYHNHLPCNKKVKNCPACALINCTNNIKETQI